MGGNVARDAAVRDFWRGLMAEYDTIRAGRAATGAAAGSTKGLRAHMNKVYGTMSVGMLITAAPPGRSRARGHVRPAAPRRSSAATVPDGLRARDLHLAAALADHVRAALFVFGLSAGINRISAGAAQLAFYAFAAVMGLSLARSSWSSRAPRSRRCS
jgi:hypothetical protein